MEIINIDDNREFGYYWVWHRQQDEDLTIAYFGDDGWVFMSDRQTVKLIGEASKPWKVVDFIDPDHEEISEDNVREAYEFGREDGKEEAFSEIRAAAHAQALSEMGGSDG